MGVTRFVVLAVCAVLVAGGCTSGDGDETPEGGSPTVAATSSAAPSASGTVVGATGTATAEVTATVTATAEASEPYRVEFAAGETIDGSPAVVFGDLETREATAWVFPGLTWEFAVSPAGDYVIYQTSEGTQLLRTESGEQRLLGALGWPLEFGPGDVGFLALDGESDVAVFDGTGELVEVLWPSGSSSNPVAAWSADGRSIAIAEVRGNDSIELALWTDLDSVPGSDEELEVATSNGVLALEWSPDSERLALVTGDAVRVFDRERTLLWTVDGEYWGNPRWSPDGAYLTVHAMPSVVGADGRDVGLSVASHLLSRDGAEVFRVTGAGSCSGGPWVDATSFTAGRYLATVDGELTAFDGRIPGVWYSPADFGFELASGIGFHLPHAAWRQPGQLLEDGRLVFTTPEIGHGGCGTIVGASEWPAIAIEWPPYGPVRSGRAIASEVLAADPALGEVARAVLDGPAESRVDALVDLAHRYEAPCAVRGEVIEACADAGLGADDTFAGIALGVSVCASCYFTEEQVRADLERWAGADFVELAGVWAIPTGAPWPYLEFSTAEPRYALWFVRSDWRGLTTTPSSLLVLVAPDAGKPVVALEVDQGVWQVHETAAGAGWEQRYLAAPAEPAP